MRVLHISEDEENLKVISNLLSNEKWMELNSMNFIPSKINDDIILCDKSLQKKIIEIEQKPIIYLGNTSIEEKKENIFILPEPYDLSLLKEILSFFEGKIHCQEYMPILYKDQSKEKPKEEKKIRSSIINFKCDNFGLNKMYKNIESLRENEVINNNIKNKIKYIFEEITIIASREYSYISVEINLYQDKITMCFKFNKQYILPFFIAKYADIIEYNGNKINITINKT